MFELVFSIKSGRKLIDAAAAAVQPRCCKLCRYLYTTTCNSLAGITIAARRNNFPDIPL
jgi:hypothetical protein